MQAQAWGRATNAVNDVQRLAGPPDPAIAGADNALGLNLFKALHRVNLGNFAISPASLAPALKMVYGGAQGFTQQAMAKALQLRSLSPIHAAVDSAALHASLTDYSPGVHLTIANSLWMPPGPSSVPSSFAQLPRTYYAARIGDVADAPDSSGSWLSKEAGGRTTTTVPLDNYAGIGAVIANDICFRAPWATAFNPRLTAEAPFTLGDGRQAACRMMKLAGVFQYYESSDLQVIRLPYGQSHRMSMMIGLPGIGANFAKFIAALSAESLNAWFSRLQMSTVDLALPRFTSSYAHPLVPALTGLGMGVAFSSAAEFSVLAPNMRIVKVGHATVVQVDETGTNAPPVAAVTKIAVVTPNATMTMNRPFFYTIRDDETGALLFIGSLVNPG